MLYNAILVSAVQQSESALHIHISTLSDFLGDAIINDKKEEIQAKLSFEPNEFAKSLDVAELEPVKNGADYQLIIAITSSIILTAAVITAAILIARAKTRRFHKSIEKYSKR